MYYRFTFYGDAQAFLQSHKDENAKLMSWHGPYMVFVPIQQQRGR